MCHIPEFCLTPPTIAVFLWGCQSFLGLRRGGLMTWLEWLRDLLCQLYQEWGGDCKDLGPSAPDWIATDCGEFAAEGAPNVATQANRNNCLDILGNLTKCLDDSRNSLAPGDDAALRSLIARLEGDISGGSTP